MPQRIEAQIFLFDADIPEVAADGLADNIAPPPEFPARFAFGENEFSTALSPILNEL